MREPIQFTYTLPWLTLVNFTSIILIYNECFVGRDNAVGLATLYGLGGQWIESW